MGFFDTTSFKASPITSTLAKCGQCGLARGCVNPRMPATGKGKHKILFVGEAPSAEEDKKSEHFISEPGFVLRKLLRPTGVALDDCWMTNAIICHPPQTALPEAAVESCRPNLITTIRRLQPIVIVLLGSHALQSLISTEWGHDVGNLSRWVGFTIPSPTYNAWICPTYHPDYLTKQRDNGALRVIMEQQLARAVSLADKPVRYLDLADLRNQVEVITSPRLGRLRMRDLAQKEGLLAYDYETTGLKPEAANQSIVSASFCHEGTDTFATVVDERSYDDLRAVVTNPKLYKIGSNIKFEQRWNIQKLGVPGTGWRWDTAIGAHVLDNRRAICSIKFQAYVMFGIGDYSSHVKHLLESPSANALNRIREIPMRDLLIYNGLDSLIEYKVAVAQMRRFL